MSKHKHASGNATNAIKPHKTSGKINAVRSPQLSAHGCDRYVIIDENTGEILDNAQGYGYKSIQKAYAGYRYATDTEGRKKRAKVQAEIRKFLKENKSVERDLEAMAFYAMKDRVEICVADIREMLKERNIDEKTLPFTLVQLKNNWYKVS